MQQVLFYLHNKGQAFELHFPKQIKEIMNKKVLGYSVHLTVFGNSKI